MVIPFNKFPTKQYVMSFSFPENITLMIDDPIFQYALKTMKNSLDFFTKSNGKTHAFVQPIFYFKPTNELGVKIETIEKKTLKEIEKRKSKK